MVTHGADERQRRDDGVDAGAVGQAGIHHGRRLVDAAAERGDDPVDDPHHVVVVLEHDVGELEPALALDVDLARAVDHDLADALVAQERLERAEADDLVGDLLEHPHPLGAGEGEALLVDDLAEDLLDLAADLDLVGQVELRVQVLDHAVLDPELDVPEGLADRGLGHQPAGRRLGRRLLGTAPKGAALSRDGNVGRSVRCRLGAGTGALDALQETHRLHPFGHGRPLRRCHVIAMRTATSSVRPSWPARRFRPG